MACEEPVATALISGMTLSGLTFLLGWIVSKRVHSWDNDPRYHGGDRDGQ